MSPASAAGSAGRPNPIHRLQPATPPVLTRLAGAALAALLAGGTACLPLTGADPAASQPPLAAPTRQGRIDNPAINESSGIVPSRKHPGAFWTINDSGGGPVLYAIDARGRSLGRCRLLGATNIDWEDIAIDASGKLHVADVGDNARCRPDVVIYSFAEPDPTRTGTAEVEAKRLFRYPPGHGPMDCEAMFVRKGWAYLVSKELLRARLYRVRLAGAAEEIAQAEYLGSLPAAAWITAADISPDGRHIAALSYTTVYVYDLPEALEKAVARATSATSPTTRRAAVIACRPRKRLARLGQCEAICWIPAKRVTDLLITNEEGGVYRLRPAAVAGTSSAPSR